MRGRYLNDYEKGLEKSHMTKHWLNCHRGEEKPKFEVKIIKTFTSCMVRQIWDPQEAAGAGEGRCETSELLFRI